MQQIMEKLVDLQLYYTYRAKVIYEESSEDEGEEIHIDGLDEAPTKMEDMKSQVHDQWKKLI